jgi:hypothetical protein
MIKYFYESNAKGTVIWCKNNLTKERGKEREKERKTEKEGGKRVITKWEDQKQQILTSLTSAH